MLNIESILNFIYKNLKDPRFTKVNEEHLLDVKTGIEIHMYDDWFKLTKGDEIIATINDFTPTEQAVIWEIKQAMSDPVKSAERKANYKRDMAVKRAKLADMFENPEPVETKVPEVEQGTIPYTG